ncbi:hypothetical protein [Ottowia testudinis]|uniref:Uncharacterized protein n=1 Tax=Ottowia testudinis TaxID=2816950 RepID=A0A975H284_9BURK|nr:hypothetical protein [Ottowia testudinis]QTD43921.1 hypothetical protein J1M35_12290 [Ottowia testudinis]
MSNILINENGVYKPTDFKFLAVLPLCIFMAVLTLNYFGKFTLTVNITFVFCIATVVYFLPPLFELQKYGPLGKPFISVGDGQLRIALLQDSRGSMQIPIECIREIKVYIPSSGFCYRFIRENGSFSEASPMFPTAINEAVLQFIRQQLPSLKLTVHEPMSFFERVRGEGP